MSNDQRTYVWVTMFAAIALFIAGCKSGGQKSDPLAAGGHPPSLPSSTAYPGDAQSTAPAVATTPLPPVQQASTTRQEYCPVTGAKLGSMGAPIPVAIGSRTVYVCCAGCVEKLTENPEQYLGPGVSSSSPNANYAQREEYAASSRATSSSTDQAGSCGSGSGGTTSGSSGRRGSGGSCCH